MAHINGCRHRRSRGESAVAHRKSPGWRAPAEPAYTRCTMMPTVTLLLLLSPAWDTAAEMPLCWPNEACVCEVTTPSTIYLTQRIKQLTTAYSMDAELHLTATDVLITPYMQRRLNATPTMDVDEAVDRITAASSCRITDVPSATDMIWEESVLTNSSVVHFPLHTTNVDSTMFSTTIGLPTSPAAARTIVVLMQNMDQTEHTHDAMRKNPAWPHNIMLVPNNNYGEMKYFILLKYLNLMRNGYPCNLLN